MSRSLCTRGVIEYPSLVEPPAGFSMLKNEIKRIAALCDNEDAMDFAEAMGIPLPDPKDPTIHFRGVVKTPEGIDKYFVMEMTSIIPLHKIEFWTEFWNNFYPTE